MKFIDWWIEFSRGCPLDMTESDMAKQAWEAGIQEGVGRKREWVGLSYRDVMGIFEHWDFNRDSSLVEFNKLELCELFEVVEAKLKEKNT